MAKLSVAAIDSSIKENETIESSKRIQAVERLNTDFAKKIHKAISFLVGNYTSARVIDEVNKLSDSKERLRLLRLWLNNNRSNIKDVESVISLALDELISSSSDSSITLDVLKDISYQLPFINEFSKKKELYKRFKTIEKDLSDLVLTKNKYVYELNIFHTEFSMDQEKSILTLNRILSRIEKIDDVLIKLEAYAEAYSKLAILKYPDLNKKINFVYSRILQLSSELYKSTANHFIIGKIMLKTIGKRNPRFALKICEQVNTELNRQKAQMLILESYLENDLKTIEVKTLKELEVSFLNGLLKQDLCLKVLERFADAKTLYFGTIKELLYFADKIKFFNRASQRLRGYVFFYRIISKEPEWRKRLSQRIEKDIYASWRKIEEDWERIDSGFQICSDIAPFNNEFAQNIFKETEIIKKESWIDSRLVAYTYLNNMKLIIKAYASLLATDGNTLEDDKIVEDLMTRIPSEIEKLRLWTDLSFQAYILGNEVFSRKILDNHLLPLVHGLMDRGLDLDEILDTLTLIHLFNPELALMYLNRIPEDLREDVYDNLCNFYITKQSPFEIYDLKDKKHHVLFNDLTKAVVSLGYLTMDANIYHNIDLITEAIDDNRTQLSKPQINTLIEQLIAIVESKLPDKSNIKHDGYKIISLMKINKLKKENQNQKAYWSSIIDESDQIPNNSDVVFVKSILLENIPFDAIDGGSTLKNKLFNDIILALKSFNVHYEFINRVIDICDQMYAINKREWKNMVTSAFNLSSELNEESEEFKSKRRIIDTMYRLDPTYAKELIRLIDNDRKEGLLGKILRDQINSLEIADKIKSNKSLDEKEKENYRNVVKAVTESIRSLNSGKIIPKKVSDVSTYLPIGITLSLHEVFPIYWYYLNNCVKTYSSKNITGSLKELHKENFKKVVKSSNLIHILSKRKKLNETSSRKFFIDDYFPKNKVLRPGTREEGFMFIRNWLFDQVEEFIIIADPYFKKEDLEILKLIKEFKGDLEIDILGSKNGNSQSLEQDFKEYWNKISNEVAPFTNITFCWIQENNQTPFHDRWILTKNSGLRMGTSINSLGKGKDSELSVMKPSEALNIKENSIFEFISRRKKSSNNMKLAYKSFSL